MRGLVRGALAEPGVRLRRVVGPAEGRAGAGVDAEDVRPEPVGPAAVAVQLPPGQTAGVGAGRRALQSATAGRHRRSYGGGVGVRAVFVRGRGRRGGRSPNRRGGRAEWRFATRASGQARRHVRRRRGGQIPRRRSVEPRAGHGGVVGGKGRSSGR